MYKKTENSEVKPDQQCVMKGGLLATILMDEVNKFLLSLGLDILS